MTSCALFLNGIKKDCPVTPSHSSSRQAADIAALNSDCRLQASKVGLRSHDTMIERTSRAGAMCVITCANFAINGSNERSSATRSLLIAVPTIVFGNCHHDSDLPIGRGFGKPMRHHSVRVNPSPQRNLARDLFKFFFARKFSHVFLARTKSNDPWR